MKLLTLTSLLWCSFSFCTLPSNYESLNGVEKQDFLWEQKILPSEYSQLPSLSPGSLQSIKNSLCSPASLVTLARTFDHISDEIPKGRKKFIHPFGSVVKVEYRSLSSHPFTGLFAEEKVSGLARLSLAGPPSVIGYTPGMALKLFVDKNPSENIQVLNSLEGQGDNANFFEKTFSNQLPPVAYSISNPKTWPLKFLEILFTRIKKDSRHLPTDSFARVTADGSTVTNPNSPAVLFFMPQEEAASFFAQTGKKDFRTVLAYIPSGTVIYKIFGVEKETKKPYLIGEIKTTSPFVASRYGDEVLFFRHNR